MNGRNGFSLVQVVIAVVVLLLVSTAVAPRFSEAALDARTATLCENLQLVRRHIEVYCRLHEGRLPASAGETGEDFTRRITGADGASQNSRPSPYLEHMPVNPYNRLATVRVGGLEAGAGTHGWRFDPTTGDFQADDRCDTDGDGLPEHKSL